MEIPTARKIIGINIAEAGKKMPPPVLEALIMADTALNFVSRVTACSVEYRQAWLNMEHSIRDPFLSKDHIQKVKESPLGQEPKG